MDYNHDILNIDSSSDMKKKYDNSLAWRCYAHRSIRNPFLRTYLYQKYNCVCQFCWKPLKENFIVHHVSYDKECVHPETLKRIARPTPKKPNRNVIVPDCENCDNIEKCTATMRPVCAICNMIIEKVVIKNNPNA